MDVDVLDVQTRKWSKAAPLPKAMRAGEALVYNDGSGDNIWHVAFLRPAPCLHAPCVQSRAVPTPPRGRTLEGTPQ